MRRNALTPRKDWQMIVQQQGLTFHSPEDIATEGRTYWDESACYQFTSAEIDRLEAAANTMQQMCLAAAQHIIDQRLYAQLEIPDAAIPLIEWAWEQEPPAIYGRFDFCYNGSSAPKLLEYNADTPTGLIEAAVIQWHWLEDSFPQADQFNSLHEKLIAKWQDVAPYLSKPVYFACLDVPEDLLTTTYLRDTAEQAGLATRFLRMEDIGWNEGRQSFLDLNEERIHSIFKLYPWEMLVQEQFGPAMLNTYREMRWMEPIWKMLLSNKGILPILWELYPGHENLLPAYFDGPRDMTSYVRKPLHSREGANITLVSASKTLQTDGPYTEGGTVYQALAPESCFDGRYPVLGLWMVDQECCGMGIRESTGPITDNLSSFIPHYFN